MFHPNQYKKTSKESLEALFNDGTIAALMWAVAQVVCVLMVLSM